MSGLIFLKLGGSLITDKDIAHHALLTQIDMLGAQIKDFLDSRPESHLLLGHGSGSFGHQAAAKYSTRQGVEGEQQWQGFAEVWFEARALNQIVIERLHLLGLPVISFPFSSSGLTRDRRITNWNINPLEISLDLGLLPVIYGDVALDQHIGGTIVSTEEQFDYLAEKLHPTKLLLAGQEPGIWQDFPKCTKLLSSFSAKEFQSNRNILSGSASVDVTGGMASKAEVIFSIIERDPGVTATIFCGCEPGALTRALNGEKIGTILTA